jgi:hypothetical protein
MLVALCTTHQARTRAGFPVTKRQALASSRAGDRRCLGAAITAIMMTAIRKITGHSISQRIIGGESRAEKSAWPAFAYRLALARGGASRTPALFVCSFIARSRCRGVRLFNSAWCLRSSSRTPLSCPPPHPATDANGTILSASGRHTAAENNGTCQSRLVDSAATTRRQSPRR